MSSRHLIVGLGNPGSQYEQTRHNIGFGVLEALAKRWDIPGKVEKKFHAIVGSGTTTVGSTLYKLILAQPTTFMNLSGQAVRALSDYYDMPVENLLIVVDDVALPLGKLRLRPGGSAGGQNGLKNIIAHLNTQDFPRLRVGVGAPATQQSLSSHVLSKFHPDDRPLVDSVTDHACTSVEHWLHWHATDFQRATSAINGLDIEGPNA